MPRRITRSDLLDDLIKERKRIPGLKPLAFEVGANLHYLYALAKKSGVLHFAMAGDMEFDENEHLISFFTFCSRRIEKKDTPDWDDKWSFFRRFEIESIPHKKYCSKCLKSVFFRSMGRYFKHSWWSGKQMNV
ncbi:MAG: hypothetical protein ACXAAO_03810 [Candidatus Thorarchaeota archaeon]